MQRLRCGRQALLHAEEIRHVVRLAVRHAGDDDRRLRAVDGPDRHEHHAGEFRHGEHEVREELISQAGRRLDERRAGFRRGLVRHN